MTSFQKYLKRLSEVIQVEAKDTSDADFLATHKPFRKLKFVPGLLSKDQFDFIDEEQFFQEVYKRQNEHQFILVQGHNGTGKSHLIRWLKEKFKHVIDPEKETVLFISRMQSTLRGALEQIIDAQVFQQSEMAENLKKLVQANQHLSSEGLKNRIIHLFAIKVKEDDESKDMKMSQRERKQLYAFLMEQDTQKFLMGPDGPIERIQKKLASEARNEVFTELSPYFEGNDFKFSYAQLQEVKKSDASSRAVRFMEEIVESTDPQEQLQVQKKRESIAQYLNLFLDDVVQECTQLRGTDLENVFRLLRKELKKQGKQLTLLIEDITSFTGIDKSLVNVLANTHKGSKEDESMCRLISVVGITNAYYENYFPSNYRERVTGHLYIDDAFGDVEDIIDMTARYLNAIYQDESTLVDWVKQGADSTRLPISPLFRDHRWAKVMIDSHEMTLFPFNETAIRNFYQKLEPKTPRRFLQNIVLRFVHMMFVGGLESFPPEFPIISQAMGTPPQWEQISDEVVLQRQAPRDFNRYMTLFRVWGNRTLNAYDLDGQTIIGGLTQDVFASFGLKPIEGNKIHGQPPNVDRPVLSGGQRGSISSGYENKRDNNPTTLEPRESTPVSGKKPETSRHPKQEQYEELEIEIEQWISENKPLASYSQLLADLLDVFRQAIHWEDEGIPAITVYEYLSPQRIQIEGQTGRVSVANPLTFKRSQPLRYVLLALAKWRLIGEKSWSFEGAGDLLSHLYTWVEQEKHMVIEYIRKPSDESVNEWRMTDWVVSAQYLSAVLAGKFDGSENTPESQYMRLTEGIKEVLIDKSRDKQWQQAQSAIAPSVKDHSEFFLRYFNRIQGEINNKNVSTEVFFLDASMILRCLENMHSVEWSIEGLGLPRKDRASWYRSSNLIHDVKPFLKDAISAELHQIEKVVTEVRSYLAEEDPEGVELFQSIPVMLQWLEDKKEPYDPQSFVFLQSPECNPGELLKTLEKASHISVVPETTLRLLALSQNPAKTLGPYLTLFSGFNTLLDKISAKYQSKKEGLSGGTETTMSLLQETQTQLKKLYDQLLLISREVSHAAD